MSEEDMSANGPESPAGEQEEGDRPNNIQTLTDLFDQLDRAAFKRVLDHRDSLVSPRNKKAEQG